MNFAKRHELGIELLQAAAFALLVAFIYHYFGPSASVSPTPEVFGVLTVCALMLVATIHQSPRAGANPADQADALAKDQTNRLVERLHEADWLQLEKVVSGIYAKLGCATWRRANVEGERNFSLVIERAGHKTAVMCKPWRDAEVTSPEIIEFSTELKQAGLAHGVLVSLRECTAPAHSVAATLGIDLVNRDGLVNLFAACDRDCQEEVVSLLAEGRKFCPRCDNEMALRTATKGLGAGEQYWGCTDAQCPCTAPH